MLSIGIIREEKQPADRRVPFTPAQCAELKAAYPDLSFTIQPSGHRCFADSDYLAEGMAVSEDLSKCDVLMGIKEVPPQFLIPGKTYYFFSHTIKKQPANAPLIKALIAKRITMVDYETLRWQNGDRILGFGRFAGIVGAYNGLKTWGLKYKTFTLEPANKCFDYEALKAEAKKIVLPPVKIALTGTGRVSSGAADMLKTIGIREVTVGDYLTKTFQEPVFVQLHSENIFERIDGKPYDRSDFHHSPEQYRSVFQHYIPETDLLINGVYWSPQTDRLFELEDADKADFRIAVIADISCDVNGAVPLTVKDTHINDPVFGWNKTVKMTTAPYLADTVDIMAVSNLPAELPRDASEGFGRMLIDNVIPEMLKPASDVITRATICSGGHLMPMFDYLENYVSGNQ